jgi:transposase-like protein
MKANELTAEQKMAIVKEAMEQGVQRTCRKHSVSEHSYRRWKGLLESGGVEALRGKRPLREPVNAELAALQRENGQLKRLLADKELMLLVKDELLKKSASRTQNGVRQS